jgi:SAM-dependent methyltransferase
MRSPDSWRPSVFDYRHGRWHTSLDPSKVAVSSRVATEVAAGAYSTAIARHARGQLLDLGCGSVPCYGMYRSLVDSIICVDWAASLHAGTHVDVIADLNKPLPLRDGHWDTVVLTDVLEHIAYPDQLWGEMARVLRPGGTLILGVPFMYWLHEQPHDYFRYTEFRLRRFCEDAGFTVVELTATGDARAVACDMTLKLLSKVLPVWMIKVLSRIAIRILADYEGLPASPQGYLLVATRQGT